jgi:hypothetical protein
MGRPKANIDWDLAGELLKAGCDGVQIASYFGCDDETLYNRCKSDLNMGFSDFLRQNRSCGDALILKAQFDAAIEDKDRGMLIWLGKNRLGQKDRSEVDNNISLPPINFVESGTDKE